MRNSAQRLVATLTLAWMAEPARAGVDAQAGLIRQLLQTGDDSLLEAPEMAAALDGVDGYMLGACGFPETRVVAVDHGYQGLPDALPGEAIALTLVNEGAEQHMIGMLRVNDGVDLSVEELIALPEEAMTMATFVGAAFAVPGDSDTVFLDLPPGRYGAVCFLPEGSIGETDGTGPAHFTLGMAGELSAG